MVEKVRQVEVFCRRTPDGAACFRGVFVHAGLLVRADRIARRPLV